MGLLQNPLVQGHLEHRVRLDLVEHLVHPVRLELLELLEPLGLVEQEQELVEHLDLVEHPELADHQERAGPLQLLLAEPVVRLELPERLGLRDPVELGQVLVELLEVLVRQELAQAELVDLVGLPDLVGQAELVVQGPVQEGLLEHLVLLVLEVTVAEGELPRAAAGDPPDRERSSGLGRRVLERFVRGVVGVLGQYDEVFLLAVQVAQADAAARADLPLETDV